MKPLLLLTLLAHILADYGLQTEKIIAGKRQGVASAHVVHALTFGLLALGLTLPWWSLVWVLCIGLLTVCHALIDAWKYRKVKTHPEKQFAFELGDQLVHVVLILAIYFYVADHYAPWFHWSALYRWLAGHSVYPACVVLAGVVFLLKGGTSLVRTLLPDVVGLQAPLARKAKTSQEAPIDFNMGRLIGNLERLMIALFVVLGQYAAVGLVITANSLARFKRLEEDPNFAEYYLVGTLTSTLIAVIVGLLIRYGITQFR